MSRIYRRGARALLLAYTVAMAACSSGFVKVAPTPPANYQKLGHAEGTACGTMLLLATAYNFIPVALNSRVERAYSNALEQVPGATALVDVTVSEDWFWWVVGTTRCLTVSGEAIK